MWSLADIRRCMQQNDAGLGLALMASDNPTDLPRTVV